MSRITLATGADPGSTRTGWATVSLDPDGWMNIDYGAHLDNASDAWRLLVTSTYQRLGFVAMEQLVGFAYEAKRVQALVETGRFEGRVLELAHMQGKQVLLYPASASRGELCRSSTASDDQVRAVVEGVTRRRPHLTAEARPHVYDAALVAILAIAKSLPHAWRLPPKVEAQLHLIRETERAKRAEKKQRAALGIQEPKEKRVLTRAQRGRRSAAAEKAWNQRKNGGV